MAKTRVYQLAKELNVQSALILEFLDRLGQEVKSDLSTLDESTAGLVRAQITEAIEAERRRLVAEQEAHRVDEDAAAAVEEPVEVEADEEPVEGAEPESEPEAPAAAPAAAAETTEADHEEIDAEIAEDETVEEPAAAAPVIPVAPRMPARPEPRAAQPAPQAPGAKPTRPLPPGAKRPPRVFPAQVIPSKERLRATTGRIRPAAPARPAPPGRPPVGGRPGFVGPGAGPAATGAGPHKPGASKGRRARKKDKTREREAVVQVPRPKPELPPVPESITLSEAVTVKELAEKLNRKAKDVIAKLIPRGVLATINMPLEPDVAVDVAKEFGSEAKVLSFEEEAQQDVAAAPLADELIEDADTDTGATVSRPPVVTVMGHVDHGKTSLLDALRESDVVGGEHGGITQHIGAYQVDWNGRKITFLDTPGHEAFTLMRARGARATDVVVLVVAADDGVKPQTLEAIDHAKAAEVPMVVAINKMDKPGANPDRVKQQLADREILVEDYGGQIVSCEVSAKKQTGLDNLLEMILLVTEMQELKAHPDKLATGVILEAKLERARGVIATVLVQDGTLHAGDPFIAGTAFGKVRAMVNEHGERVKDAGPSSPVEVMGLGGEPTAGDLFQAVKDESRARQIANHRLEKKREVEMAASGRRTTLESLADEIRKGEVKQLPVLLKADVQGSIEALRGSLGELPSDKVKIDVLRSGTGAINQADVLLASASNAIIVGFNVRPDRAAADLAERERVQIRQYTVIYDVIDEIKQAMVGMLEPTIKENVLGQVEVRQLFKVPKIGIIAGCYVTDGKIKRNAEVRLIRDNVLIYTGKVGSLRRFKDDVSEVKSGYECGVGIAGYNDLKEGDVIEFFEKEQVAAESL